MMNKYDLLHLVSKQINNFWSVDLRNQLECVLEPAFLRTEQDLQKVNDKYICSCKHTIQPSHSISWSIFLYFLSYELYVKGDEEAAEYVYYLNKVMHANDWFYAVELPTHLWAEHPVGSVLGRASYGDYFMIYQGCTVGGNQKGQKTFYPQLGHHFMMYANSTILGESKTGNNVVLSVGAYVKDEIVPDNSIVYGQSPNLVIKQKTQAEMEEIFSTIWK